ncbi:MAG TPA: radical SAM protein [bacterium]|nr:radical SAM protein [bacterium]
MTSSKAPKYIPYFASAILNESRDDKTFRYTLNPYRGCEHSCLYCYVQADRYRPTQEIGEFFTRIQVKSNAVYLLRKAMEKGRLPGLVTIGSSSDPYQPAEGCYNITRRLLEILFNYGQPVHIFTKSGLIMRDLPLLLSLNEKSLVLLNVSIISLRNRIASFFEPLAPSPGKRMEIIHKFSRGGIKTGLALMPVLPFITDGEIEDVILKAKLKGASFVFCEALNLREGHRERFYYFLKEKFPDLLPRYQGLYGDSVSPSKNYRDSLNEKVERIAGKYGLSVGIDEEWLTLVSAPEQRLLL